MLFFFTKVQLHPCVLVLCCCCLPCILFCYCCCSCFADDAPRVFDDDSVKIMCNFSELVRLHNMQLAATATAPVAAQAMTAQHQQQCLNANGCESRQLAYACMLLHPPLAVPELMHVIPKCGHA
jgi:hypothetical protein